MSAPAQKPRPAPVTTTARTDGSVAAPSIACRNSVSMRCVQALSLSGRFSVTVSTWSATCRLICS